MNENVNACPLCHSPLHVTEFRKPPFEVRRCAACGFVYVTPRSREGQLAGGAGDDPATLAKWLELALEHGPAGGRALDVGAERGAGVTALSRRGFDASAAGPLDGEADGQLRVDLITMWDVIARMPNPAAVLRHARARLLPGGRLAMVTGDVDSRAARWRRRRGRHFDPAVYVVGFNPSTVRRVLGESGFELERLLHRPTRMGDEMLVVALRRARIEPR